MIETLIVTVFLIFIGFATFQLIILAVTKMVCNEATFSASRVAMVSRTNVNANIRASLLYALYGQIPSGQLLPSVLNPPSANSVNLDANGQNSVEIKDVTFRYAVKVMFGSFFSPFGINMGYLNTLSNGRTIISPDAEYYEKAYPSAPRFNE